MPLRAVWLRLFAVTAILAGGSLPLTHAAGQALLVQDDAAIIAIHTLADIPLAELQNAALPDHPITDDRGMLLGGIGSDLWHVPGDPPEEFWMVTDRGPNTRIEVGDERRRIFPVPEFTPLILHVRSDDGELAVVEAIPVVNQRGEPVTGLPNLKGADEKPYDVSGEEQLDRNQDGLDVEGFVRTADGEFWLADEYRPSLVKVDATGKVLTRFVPEGTTLPEAGYPVAATLPEIYDSRQENNGFEGLALSGDGQTLYAVLQSPLGNPDDDAVKDSRVGRILAVDAASGQPVAEYVYHFETEEGFDPGMDGDDENDRQDELKISGLVWLDEATLLALERTDELARLYTLDLSGATDILGTEWDDAGTSPTMEELESLASEDIVPLPKTELLDLEKLDGMPDKIEGVAMVDDQTVAVINDNDFEIDEFDDEGQHEGNGIKSQLLLIELSQE